MIRRISMDNTPVAKSKYYIYAHSRTTYFASFVKHKLLSVWCARGFLKHLPPLLYLHSQCEGPELQLVFRTFYSLSTLYSPFCSCTMAVEPAVSSPVAWWLVVIKDFSEGLIVEFFFSFSFSSLFFLLSFKKRFLFLLY